MHGRPFVMLVIMRGRVQAFVIQQRSYENLRRRTALPLLKVETDFTPLSSGQLSTRLEAFLEGLELRPAPAAAARRGAYVAGIDSGSTTTNVVVLDRAGNVAASAIVRTGPKASQGAEKAFAALGGFTPEDMAAIVATGSEVKKGLIQDTFTPVVKEKLAAYGIETISIAYSGDGVENVANAIGEARKTGADLILCLSLIHI